MFGAFLYYPRQQRSRSLYLSWINGYHIRWYWWEFVYCLIPKLLFTITLTHSLSLVLVVMMWSAVFKTSRSILMHVLWFSLINRCQFVFWTNWCGPYQVPTSLCIRIRLLRSVNAPYITRMALGFAVPWVLQAWLKGRLSKYAHQSTHLAWQVCGLRQRERWHSFGRWQPNDSDSLRSIAYRSCKQRSATSIGLINTSNIWFYVKSLINEQHSCIGLYCR